MFFEKGILRNFAKFTGQNLCESLFFNEDAQLRPATLLKKRLWHRCFPVNFVKLLRTPFFTEQPFWLLLFVMRCNCGRVEKSVWYIQFPGHIHIKDLKCLQNPTKEIQRNLFQLFSEWRKNEFWKKSLLRWNALRQPKLQLMEELSHKDREGSGFVDKISWK